MADKIKKSTKVTRIIPLSDDPNAPTDEYYAVNFKGYRIQKGIPVEVPIELAEVMDNAQRSMREAYAYAQANKLREPDMK